MPFPAQTLVTSAQIPKAREFWIIQKFPSRPEIPATVSLKQSSLDLLPAGADSLLGRGFNIRATLSQASLANLYGIKIDIATLTQELEDLDSQFTSLCEGKLSIQAIFDAEPTV